MVKNIGFLFDLDGVLIDSESEYSRIWAQINKEFPTGVQNLELVIKGCTLTKILNDFYPDNNTGLQVSNRLHELENVMQYKYLPFAEEFLIALQEMEIPRALVTSSAKDKMNHLKEEIPDILDRFNVVVTAEFVTKSKPDPEGYLIAANKLEIHPKNCVVFEDSLQGVMAGKRAGAYVIGVEGTLPAETIRPYCDMVIKNFSEIMIQSLLNILSKR